MKRSLLMLICILTGFVQFSFNARAAPIDKEISIIPYPKEVKRLAGVLLLPANQFSVKLPEELSDLISIFKKDMQSVFIENLNTTRGKAVVNIELVAYYPKDGYELSIQQDINIKGGSYQAVLMAWSSLMQLASKKDKHISFPKCLIKDNPDLEYRGLLLDVARKFQSIPSIKNIIEACRWYKINYLQLHLNDDDLFVFPSKAFPKLPTVGKSYSVEEMKDLVQFATARGVTLIPEFDAPAHTGSLRKAYPELFGVLDLRIIDLGNPKVIGACKVIVGEMMEVFNTSPYFHIGADEVNLERFALLESTKHAVQQKDFDSPHDLYLNYIVEMHEFVKSKGFKTLAWEGFDKDGSNKVKIPKDILVFAWESFYQRPDELIDNGFSIINASWKPIYITPEKRWKQKDIYNWNIWRWENFNKKAPSFSPIQLKGAYKDKVLGTQMCAWEMTEEMNLPAILQRLPALSENAWNLNAQKDYDFFKRRYHLVNDELGRLLFSAIYVKTGLQTGQMHERFYNRENYFSNQIKVSVKPLLKDVSVRYTLNGSVPTQDDQEMKGELKIDSTAILRISLFKNNQLIGYSSELLEKRPIALVFSGNIEDTENAVDGIENFANEIVIRVKKLNSKILPRYTTDGSLPTTTSTVFDLPITVSNDTDLKIQCFNPEGKPDGVLYKVKLKKLNN